jgi:hypothetical protein
VRVFCNIHPTMSAVIVVVDTPWFVTTEKDGSFRFADVPPGNYRLHVFHERATAEELSKSERTLVVGSDVTLPAIRVSEAGWLPVPHLNKHNRPYNPQSDSYKVMK